MRVVRLGQRLLGVSQSELRLCDGLLQGRHRGPVQREQALALLHLHLRHGTLGAKGQRFPVGEDKVAVCGDLVGQVAILDGYKLLVLGELRLA